MTKEEGIPQARDSGDTSRLLIQYLRQYLNNYIFDRASGFIAVSTELQKVISKRTDCPPDRIGVVPVPLQIDPSDTGVEHSTKEFHGITTDKILLTVTNLKFRAKFEGVKRILEEVLPVLRDNTDLSYVIAGGGIYESALQTRINERTSDPTVRRRIHTPGHVDRISGLYAIADVFAYVSHLDGYPNVVLEAQSFGLPVVANDAHGMRDQVTHGETGYLVDVDSPGELTNRIRRLFDNEETRQRMGRLARERVHEENSPAAVNDLMGAFLHRLKSDLDST